MNLAISFMAALIIYFGFIMLCTYAPAIIAAIVLVLELVLIIGTITVVIYELLFDR